MADAAGGDAPSGAASDLTEREHAVLTRIVALQDAGQYAVGRRIADGAGVPRSALSWYVQQLESKGWLRREGPASDRRYVVLARPDARPAARCSACGGQPATDGDLCADCAARVSRHEPAIAQGGEPGGLSRRGDHVAGDDVATTG